MTSGTSRLVGVDVLRAMAIVGVIAEHLRESAVIAAPANGIEILAWQFAGVGGYGVMLFFTISGFVITRTVIQRDGNLPLMRIGAFYVRRVARLGPALALYLALGLIALYAADRNSDAASFILFGNARFTPVFWLSIATSTFNFQAVASALAGDRLGWNWIILWSLSVEEQFYLFFPLLARAARIPRNFWSAIAGLILLGYCSRLATQAWLPAIWPFATPDCLDSLAAGVAVAACPTIRLSRRWALRSATLGFAILLIGFAVVSPALWAAKPLIIAVGAGLVMAANANGKVFTGRLWRPLARIGRISYGMYLFHPLALLALAPVLRFLPFLPALALLVAMTTLAADLSFALIERPVGRWILGRGGMGPHGGFGRRRSRVELAK